jgi:hypothetical protein
MTGNGQIPTAPDDLALLRAYEPVVAFTAGELFFPTAVGPYVERCSLWADDAAETRGEQLVPAGELTAAELARLGRVHRDRPLHLRFVNGPLDRAALRRWRREERPRLQGSDRLAAVGVFTRVVDSLLRVSLLLRGRVPGGLAAAAEVASREHLGPDRFAYHGRVVRDGGYVVLQYWYFSVFNDWRSTFAGVNDHEADWEMVGVYLADLPEGPEPRWVAASSHDHAGDELRRRWDDPLLRREGAHPVIFAGAGSHAGYFVPGDQIVAIELPFLRRIVDGATRVWRRIAPGSRESIPREAFALPFLDYARGDGLTIGPAHPQTWDAIVIDDATPWVRDFRGLWGLDTRDAFGGERAPAGPRYERAGTVRPSWVDPVGWAGLQKVAPGGDLGTGGEQAHLAASVDELEREQRRLDDDIATARIELRTLSAQVTSFAQYADMRNTAVARRAELARRERDLAAAYLQRSRVVEELAVHRDTLRHPWPTEPPDAHLSGAPPTQVRGREERERRRLLRVWAAVSTPLLVLTIVVLLIGPPWAFATSVAVFLVAFLGVEAAARGRLLGFAGGLVSTVLTVAVVIAFAAGLVSNWRAVLAVVLGLAALVLLVTNIRELRR